MLIAFEIAFHGIQHADTHRLLIILSRTCKRTLGTTCTRTQRAVAGETETDFSISTPAGATGGGFAFEATRRVKRRATSQRLRKETAR